MPKSANAIDEEIHKFDRVADIWWDPKGEMGTLHTINPLRMQFIQHSIDLRGARILDVGCGGGILAEAMTRAGAGVIGIDLSKASLDAARHHARMQDLQIEYRLESLDELVHGGASSFDAVTCMEMLEHVPEPQRILEQSAKVIRTGGHFFCSSINRTMKAWLFAIIGGEYILKLLPRGSHTYRQLIRPEELISWAGKNGLGFENLSSFMYNIFTGTFRVDEGKEDVNYIAHFVKKSTT